MKAPFCVCMYIYWSISSSVGNCCLLCFFVFYFFGEKEKARTYPLLPVFLVRLQSSCSQVPVLFCYSGEVVLASYKNQLVIRKKRAPPPLSTQHLLPLFPFARTQILNSPRNYSSTIKSFWRQHPWRLGLLLFNSGGHSHFFFLGITQRI